MRRLIQLFLILSLGVVFFTNPAFADGLVLADPMYIGVGARPLGMGKAYVALAEGGDAIFINPAGLGGMRQPCLTSMFANLMGDVDYTVFGGGYPITSNSAFGLGAVMMNAGGIDLRTSAGVANGTGTWKKSVIFVGYGLNLENIRTKIGANLKYYSQGGDGNSNISEAISSGLGMDLGLIYSFSDDLSLGLAVQNVGGAKLKNSKGTEQTINQVLKVGSKLNLYPFGGQKLTLVLDADLLSGGAQVWHVGAEYFPLKNLALRLGLEKDINKIEDETNPTAGVGLRLGGMEFNYAYHPYNLAPENGTHFFSISYVGQEKKIPAAEKASGTQIVLSAPLEKAIIYGDKVEVTGRVVSELNQVFVNDKTIEVNAKDKTFSTIMTVPDLGKNIIVVRAGEEKIERAILRLVNYSDVKGGYWAKEPIENMGTLGLIKGYPDGTFRPQRSLTRAELAALLIRAKGLDVSKENKYKATFKDVQKGHWAAGYVEKAQELGLIQGYPKNQFKPNKPVTRAEAIAVLARFDLLEFSATEQPSFVDVGADHWGAKYVEAAKKAGLLEYIEDKALQPNKNVTRAEVVEMFSHTALANKQTEEKLSWQ